MLQLVDVKHRVGLWVSKAWPEVLGSLVACAEADVPVSILPLQGTQRVSGPFP